MDCQEVQDQLIDFHEDQLDQKAAEHIRGHLEMCPLCRGELSSIEKVMVGLESQRLPDPGEAFWRDFPKRVRRAFYEGRRTIRVPILPRVREVFYQATTWLPFSKPVNAAVWLAVMVLIIAGLLFFKGGLFWTGSRGIGEETLEEYFGGMGAAASPVTPGSLEGLSLSQLEDVSKSLMGLLNGMGSTVEEVLKGESFSQGQDIFVQLEGLSSEELDFVYDILRTRYRKSTTFLSIPMG